MAKRKKTETKTPAKKNKANKINRKQLLDALTKVRPGIANKEIVEQSTFFNFDNDRIWTDNDEVSISQKFQSNITGSIKAQQFYELINRLPFDDIFISQEDNKLVITDDAKFKADINVVETIRKQNVTPPGPTSKNWLKLPSNFAEAATFNVFSASRDMRKPEFCCVYFVKDEDKSFAISCDGYRGTMYYLDDNIEKDFLLPATAAKHMTMYNPTKCIIEENWMHFMNNENTIVSCRVIADSYPDQIWDFFDVDGKEVELPADTSSVIKRVETLVVEEFDIDRSVAMTFEKNKVTCVGQSQLGKVTESIDIDYDDEKMEIKVHPTLLVDILKHLSTVELGERLKFKSDKFEHVVCLSEVDED